MEHMRVKSGKGPPALSLITRGNRRLMVIEEHMGWMNFRSYFLKTLFSENYFWERTIKRRWSRRFSSLRGRADTCPNNSVLCQYAQDETIVSSSISLALELWENIRNGNSFIVDIYLFVCLFDLICSDFQERPQANFDLRNIFLY